jgi:hypothetical protein
MDRRVDIPMLDMKFDIRLLENVIKESAHELGFILTEEQFSSINK